MHNKATGKVSKSTVTGALDNVNKEAIADEDQDKEGERSAREQENHIE